MGIHFCKLFGDSLGWSDFILDGIGHSCLQAGRQSPWIALGVHFCKLALDCTEHSFLHVGWRIVLDDFIISCRLVGDLLEQHWAFISARCLAIALDCSGHHFCTLLRHRLGSHQAFISVSWPAFALDRIGRSFLQARWRPLWIALGIRFCMLAGDSFWIALGWWDTVLYHIGPSLLQAVRIFGIASGIHFCRLVDNCFGQSYFVLDRIGHSFPQTGRQLPWIALGVHFCNLAGNRFGLHRAFMSACWLANRFGLHWALLPAVCSEIALNCIGRSPLPAVRQLPWIALGIMFCRSVGHRFDSHQALISLSWPAIALECIGRSFLQASWQPHSVCWLANRFGLRWAFISACWLANCLGSNRALLPAGWSDIVLYRAGPSLLQSVKMPASW